MVYAVMLISNYENPKETMKPFMYCVGYSKDPHVADRYRELREEIGSPHDYSIYRVAMFSDDVFEQLLRNNDNFNAAEPIDIISQNGNLVMTSTDEEFCVDSLGSMVDQFIRSTDEFVPILNLFTDPEIRSFLKRYKALRKRLKDGMDDDMWESIKWVKAMKHFI